MLNTMTIIAMLVVGGTLGYWVQDRKDPVRLTEYKVLTPVVAPGKAVKVLYVLDRSRVCRVRVEQVIYDAENLRYSPDDLNYVHDPASQKLGPDSVGMAVRIPDYMVEGKARHRAVRAYYCNPLQYWLDWPIILIGPDAEFEIRHGD